MHTKWAALVYLIIVVGLIGYSVGQEKERITCTGKVVHSQGRPVSGAKVSLYKLIVHMDTMSFDAELAEVTDTNDEGAFSFDTAAETNDVSDQSIILIEKEGLALGWVNWYLRQSLDTTINLGAPEVLAGKVVDESGEPVSDAEVSISVMLMVAGNEPRYTAGKISGQLFTRKTDAAGKFRFERIPSEAAAEFIVKKPGLATVSTLHAEAMEQMQLQFKAGRTDIEIKLPAEAKVDGMVVEKETGKPVPSVKLMVFQGQKRPFTGLEPITSARDGTFTIDSLGPGKHIVRAIPVREGTSNWVGGMVEVDIEAGKTSTGVKLELSKGGLVEITVTEQDDNTPVEAANVTILSMVPREQLTETTDANGLVTKRLAPGEYKITHVYKQDYQFERKEKTFTVEDSKTSRVAIELKGYPKVAGILRDENGQPVAGAKVKVCPIGRGDYTSDSEGRFIVRREASEWAADVVPYVVARHFERNLAAAVAIEEDIKVMDVNMTTGVVCTGRIVDVNDKPIENAEVYLTFWSSGHGTSMARQDNKTDVEGRYAVKAVPHHYKYSVNAEADGYGQDYVNISTEDTEDRYEVKDITLAVANLSIGGVVVDVDDNPVEDARIYCQGRGQPHKSLQTDKDGKFTIDGVCAGTIRISVSKSSGNSYLSGNGSFKVAQTDVRIVMSDSSSRSARREPQSLVGKSLPDSSIFKIEPALTDIEDKVILICFWDMDQRPSRHCLMQLSRRAHELKAEGIIIIAIQASEIERIKLEEWGKENDITLPVGMVEGDSEKIRFAWGVKSLPWLILTDRSHVIHAEGLGFDNLDNMIEEMNNVAQ